MTLQNDSKELAKNFLDLWQKQLDSMLKESSVTDEMFKNLNNMQKSFLAVYNNQNDETKSPNSDVSEHGDDELSIIKQRLSACEERISSLESRLKEGS